MYGWFKKKKKRIQNFEETLPLELRLERLVKWIYNITCRLASRGIYEQSSD